MYNQTDISVCMTKEGCEDPFSQEAFLKQCHLIKNTNLQFTFWVDDRDIISQWVDTQCSFKTKSLNMLPDLGRPKN